MRRWTFGANQALTVTISDGKQGRKDRWKLVLIVAIADLKVAMPNPRLLCHYPLKHQQLVVTMDHLCLQDGLVSTAKVIGTNAEWREQPASAHRRTGKNRDVRYYTQSGLEDTIYAAIADGIYPQYGYGIVQAVALAGSLGYPRMSALELGVAGGNGLLELERLSKTHSGLAGVDIQVAGFDSGVGLPGPVDHRDLPYVWQPSFFGMDEAALRRRFSTASLYLGDIADTGRDYIAGKPAPIGFISFDFDYYSSTVKAFEALLEADVERYLPRVVCYFDDTVGPHHVMHSCFTGEMLAIDEFNAAQQMRKIGKLNGLRYKIPSSRRTVGRRHLYPASLRSSPLQRIYVSYRRPPASFGAAEQFRAQVFGPYQARDKKNEPACF